MEIIKYDKLSVLGSGCLEQLQAKAQPFRIWGPPSYPDCLEADFLRWEQDRGGEAFRPFPLLYVCVQEVGKFFERYARSPGGLIFAT